jgi:integrase
MSKKQGYTLEKYIFVERRNGSFRFKITVHPLKDNGTFSSEKEGAAWARRRRQELIEERDGGVREIVTPVLRQAYPPNFEPIPTRTVVSDQVRMSDVFDFYERYQLKELAGEHQEASRLRLLRQCFEAYMLHELSEKLVKTWIADRFAGKYGSGRPPSRGKSLQLENGKPITKHQRHYRKKFKKTAAGQELAENVVHPVSSQTVRHELKLLRRAVTMFLKQENRWLRYGAWWQMQYMMTMKLPPVGAPRYRRISDDEMTAIFGHVTDRFLRAAMLFAVLTSLRRGEYVSLLWQDIDWERHVVRLRKPGHMKKSKVCEREVPLLPAALKVLQDLGPLERGLIFPVSAVDVSTAWRAAADAAGIYDAVLHDCRREAISRMVEIYGMSLQKVRLFSGHSESRTLEKHYLRLDPSKLALELSSMPDAFSGMPSV